MDTVNPFPTALRSAIKKSGIPQRKLAESVGISQALIQAWLSLRSAPTAEQGEALVAALGLDQTARDDFLDALLAAHLKGRLLARYVNTIKQLKAVEARIEHFNAAGKSRGE